MIVALSISPSGSPLDRASESGSAPVPEPDGGVSQAVAEAVGVLRASGWRRFLPFDAPAGGGAACRYISRYI